MSTDKPCTCGASLWSGQCPAHGAVYAMSVARQQIRDEEFRAKVEAEKVRIRGRRSMWQRLCDALPFTITIERKTP